MSIPQEITKVLQCSICQSTAAPPVVSSCCQRVVACGGCNRTWCTASDSMSIVHHLGCYLVFELRRFNEIAGYVNSTDHESTEDQNIQGDWDSDTFRICLLSGPLPCSSMGAEDNTPIIPMASYIVLASLAFIFHTSTHEPCCSSLPSLDPHYTHWQHACGDTHAVAIRLPFCSSTWAFLMWLAVSTASHKCLQIIRFWNLPAQAPRRLINKFPPS